MPAKKQVPKEMILSAALKLLKEYGCEAVNIKRLAAELGCSTQPIYLSFSGMEQLRNELIPLAVSEFEKYMKRNEDSEVVRLYDINYIRFAKEEPQLFCFLFMRTNSFAEIKQALLPIIERSVSELADIYGISYEQADILHDQLWMHSHGIAAMIATEFCEWNMEKAAKMLDDCKAALTKEYEK